MKFGQEKIRLVRNYSDKDGSGNPAENNKEKIKIQKVLYVDDALEKVKDKELLKDNLENNSIENEDKKVEFNIDLVEKINDSIIEQAEKCDISILDVEMKNKNLELQNAIRKPIEDILNNKENFEQVFEKIRNTEKQLEDLGIKFAETKGILAESGNRIWIQKSIQCFPREGSFPKEGRRSKDYHGDISSYFNNDKFPYLGGSVLGFMKENDILGTISGLGIANILKEKNKRYIFYTTGLQAHDPAWMAYALALDVISPEEIIGVVRKMLEDEETKLNKDEDIEKKFKIQAPQEKVYMEGRLAVINTSNQELKIQGLQQLLQKLS
jgi:hypothetical protein